MLEAVARNVSGSSGHASPLCAHCRMHSCMVYVSPRPSPCIVQVFGDRLIAATGAVASLQAPAASYLHIRAFAQPALLVSIVTQSCLLAQKDSRSPALAVALQVAVNATLDSVLIAYAGAGVAGAAWATVIAQYLGMLLLLQRLHAKRTVWYRGLKVGWDSVATLWKVLAPLVVVYVSRNMCYALLQVRYASVWQIGLGQIVRS